MCGIFGALSAQGVNVESFRSLSKQSQRRGSDASGILTGNEEGYRVNRSHMPVSKLVNQLQLKGSTLAVGHSRLITNGFSDNQPIIRDGVCVFHNGIVVNAPRIWASLNQSPKLEIDSEVIAAIVRTNLDAGKNLEEATLNVLQDCEGTVAAVVLVPEIGQLSVFSNNGSLFTGWQGEGLYFASEKSFLGSIGCSQITQIHVPNIHEIPISEDPIQIRDIEVLKPNLISKFVSSNEEANLLSWSEYDLIRCTRCILPESMPFIDFDSQGVCNFCRNYRKRNEPKPFSELLALVEGYRRFGTADCIVPFSGGRDSSFALHVAVKELGMRPIAYTYDWGMITDLGRRNISRMCAELSVENIVISANIRKKRKNISINLRAWLKNPDLGLLSLLTSGDKHFFRYIEHVKRETGIPLNLWGINPLEVTHFKAGFLGIKPDFENDRVYRNGFVEQLNFQHKRMNKMMKSPSYFNTSLWDTLSGEYWRSVKAKRDYFHLFDFWHWDESQIDETLEIYNWEKSEDTNTTWRIGDGTAAFYNYVYYTVAGFTEHDTFRSNQIREGDLDRDRALDLVKVENRPIYPGIKWYLDTLDLDFADVISTVNRIPKWSRIKLT